MDYNIDDWDRMQREAERRVRNSRERNAKRLNNDIQIPDFLRPASITTEHTEQSNKKKKGNILDMINVGNLDIDSDRSMILMLLALLSGEESDDLLLLALMYIMM